MIPGARSDQLVTRPALHGIGRRLTVLVCAAAFGTGVRAGDADQAELQALRAEIQQMIGTATCANLVHCRALALGTRPCGGPAEYLAYSSFMPDREQLESKAFEYTLLQEEIQRKETVAGPCVVLPAPRLQCINRHCRIENAQP